MNNETICKTHQASLFAFLQQSSLQTKPLTPPVHTESKRTAKPIFTQWQKVADLHEGILVEFCAKIE